MTVQHDDWSDTLDVLEARLSRQEAALETGQLDGAFGAVALPSRTPTGAERVRAQLALERVRRLDEELRRRKAASSSAPRGRTSPYS